MLLQAAKEILKDLRFTGYEPDFRIPESFSGEIQAPRRDAVLNLAGAAENPLYRRIWLATQALGDEPLGLGSRKPGGSIGSPMEHLESLSSFHIWDMRRAGA